jgi:hypothetical protein
VCKEGVAAHFKALFPYLSQMAEENEETLGQSASGPVFDSRTPKYKEEPATEMVCILEGEMDVTSNELCCLQ